MIKDCWQVFLGSRHAERYLKKLSSLSARIKNKTVEGFNITIGRGSKLFVRTF
jgi:hypothetical protein